MTKGRGQTGCHEIIRMKVINVHSLHCIVDNCFISESLGHFVWDYDLITVSGKQLYK